MAHLAARHSRRRFLSLAAGAATSALLAAHARGVEARAFPASSMVNLSTAHKRLRAPLGIPHILAPDATPRFRAVAEALMDAMRQAQIPGAALGIFADGTEEYATFGVESIATGVPVDAETLFEMGSIGKTYTATAIMRLMERGWIDLDAPLRTYLPDLRLADPDVAARVTTAHLLTHTGGWYGDALFDTGSDGDAIARFVREKLPTLPQIAPLGMFYNYNNSGFALLGRLIEVVTGTPYRDAMQDLILDPLSLAASTFTPEVVLQQRHAESHGVGTSGVEIERPLFIPRSFDAAGALWTTAADLVRYARFHLGDGTMDGRRVLAPETLRLMQTPRVNLPGEGNGAAGMNWGVLDQFGARVIGHTGQTFGQTADLYMVPEKGIAIALLMNAGENAGAAEGAVLPAWYAQYTGTAAGGGQASPPPDVPAMAPEKLTEYAGRYSVPNLTFTLRSQNGALVLTGAFAPLPDEAVPSILPQFPSDAPVAFVGEDTALAGSDAENSQALIFLRKPDGSVGWLSTGNRLYPRTATT